QYRLRRCIHVEERYARRSLLGSGRAGSRGHKRLIISGHAKTAKRRNRAPRGGEKEKSRAGRQRLARLVSILVFRRGLGGCIRHDSIRRNERRGGRGGPVSLRRGSFGLGRGGVTHGG